MLIYKATSTLDGYLPPLDYTDDKAQADVMVVGGKAIVLAEFPKLRGIFKTGVGTDNLPFDEAAARGVEIALPSEATCDVIYEETAAFACHLVLQGLFAGAGDWDAWRKEDRPQLAGRRLLVIGAGRIGRRVMDKMGAFMQVDSFDSATDAGEALEGKVRAADCVTLHVPLTEETRNLFDAERLGWLRDGAVLVNTARGPVIDEDALYGELSAGRLRAAIDVFWKEPYRGRLAELPADRFLRTPHIASTCREFVQGTANDFLAFMAALGQR
jgi:phosphoglycerate dehydrogenase-like enzyme